jgi:hypothetical protein
MAHLVRLILTALVLALVAPGPGAQAGADAALWAPVVAEVAATPDPPEATDPPRPEGPLPRPAPEASARTRRAARPTARARIPEARGPPQP